MSDTQQWIESGHSSFESEDFGCLSRDISHDMYTNQMVNAAFPAEAAEEGNEGVPLVVILGEDDLDRNVEATAEAEDELVESIPLPNLPESEHCPRVVWNKLPFKARAGIRRLHKQFGHCPKHVLIQILKASKAPKEYLDAVSFFRCESCELNKPEPQTHTKLQFQSHTFSTTV